MKHQNVDLRVTESNTLFAIKYDLNTICFFHLITLHKSFEISTYYAWILLENAIKFYSNSMCFQWSERMKKTIHHHHYEMPKYGNLFFVYQVLILPKG